MKGTTKKYFVKYYIRNNDCYDPYARRDEDIFSEPCISKKSAIKFIDELYSSEKFSKITKIELVEETRKAILYYRQ